MARCHDSNSRKGLVPKSGEPNSVEKGGGLQSEVDAKKKMKKKMEAQCEIKNKNFMAIRNS